MASTERQRPGGHSPAADPSCTPGDMARSSAVCCALLLAGSNAAVAVAAASLRVSAVPSRGVVGLTPMPDSGFVNVTEVLWQAESGGVYIGSPSVVRLASGIILASHDYFGALPDAPRSAYVFASADDGQTWAAAGNVTPMYWSTLFTRPNDTNVYIMGTSSDNYDTPAQIVIAGSADGGATWSAPTALTPPGGAPYSTGPTPVLLHGGRLWRAYERNVGPAWGAGYASLVISAPADAVSLLNASAWTPSGELPFANVSGLVPANWSLPTIAPQYGWLEGNAVEPVNASDPGVHIILRVNSLPAANKAALLYVASPTAAPAFVAFVDLPGGMSKFSIRRHPETGLYVTASNNVVDAGVSVPATCVAPIAPLSGVLPCCSMGQLYDCMDGTPTCMWCHAAGRNNLTLSVSSDLINWTVAATLLQDNTGNPQWMSQLMTGFQYVDWQFDNGDADLLMAVRASYRGANNYHNANRLLYQYVRDWQSLLPPARGI
jgi:hypothetical protein